MELKQDICPHCGCEETLVAKQFGQGCVASENAMTLMKNSPLMHIICRKCGTVVRSYVKYPGNLT